MMNSLFKKENLILLCFLALPFMLFLSSAPITETIMTAHISHQYALFAFCVIMAITFIRNRWLSAFMIIASIWLLCILVLAVTYPGMPKFIIQNAFDSLMFILIGAVVYTIIAASKIPKEVFYNIICVSALVQAAISLCQFFYADPFIWFLNTFFHRTIQLLGPHTLTGTLGNNNFLGAYIAISLPFFFRRKWCYFLPLLAVVLVLANTTTSFVAALVGTSYFIWQITKVFNFRNLMIFAGFIVAAALYAFLYHPSILDVTSPLARWVLWQEALRQIFYSPMSVLLGYGPGAGWGKPFPMHNEWLQITHQYGLLGLTLLIGYVVTVTRKNLILFTAFLIVLVNMLGNYPLHLAPSAFLIIIIAGLLEREKKEEEDGQIQTMDQGVGQCGNRRGGELHHGHDCGARSV